MEENQNNPQQEQHLFDNFEYTLTPASTGKRFANYLIDLAFFYLFMILFSFVLVEISYDFAVVVYGESEDGFDLVSNIIFLLFYGMFMGIIEAIFKGRSLGKIITGTIAVNEDGSRIGGQTALLRGLCRAVPFNAFSALGSPSYPWHDRWTKTRVVNIKDLRPQP